MPNEEGNVTLQQTPMTSSGPFPRTVPPSVFVADVMLGRLARWLRAAGVDVSYDSRASDDQLIQIFLQQRRQIVTRDRGLVRRRIARHAILIESEILEEQLQEFFQKARPVLTPDALLPFSRCVECNALLVVAAREDARKRVPPYVFENHSAFKLCPCCNKIFWAGTHRQRIRQLLLSVSPGTSNPLEVL